MNPLDHSTKGPINGIEVPMGFNMALARNAAAMDFFATLPDDEKRSIIAGTTSIGSKEEMQSYVSNMLKRGK